MKILTDLHTHTMVSHHVFSTLMENIEFGKTQGIELIAMTDHAPAIPDGAHEWHFLNSRNLPSVVNGVKLLKGAEVNILGKSGEIDLKGFALECLDLIIASIHNPTYADRDAEDHTETWLNVMENPYIDILGHPGRDNYYFDVEAVTKKAKEKNICIELNEHTLVKSQKSDDFCREIALACKRNGTKVVINSDAHFCTEVGVYEKVPKMLEEIDFPEELIMNTNASRFIKYLEEKRNKKYNF